MPYDSKLGSNPDATAVQHLLGPNGFAELGAALLALNISATDPAVVALQLDHPDFVSRAAVKRGGGLVSVREPRGAALAGARALAASVY